MSRRIILAVCLAASACASTAEFRAAPPKLKETFRGNQKSLAACVAEHTLDGAYPITPILRDDPPVSLVSCVADNDSGFRWVVWEMRFEQIGPSTISVELRTRAKMSDEFARSTGEWRTVVSCSEREAGRN